MGLWEGGNISGYWNDMMHMQWIIPYLVNEILTLRLNIQRSLCSFYSLTVIEFGLYTEMTMNMSDEYIKVFCLLSAFI